jgi:hypothetical protein
MADIREEIASLVEKLIPDDTSRAHKILFPNGEPEDFREFSNEAKKGLERYVRIIIKRAGVPKVSSLFADDLQGYMYEALRINFLCGLLIGLIARKEEQ